MQVKKQSKNLNGPEREGERDREKKLLSANSIGHNENEGETWKQKS